MKPIAYHFKSVLIPLIATVILLFAASAKADLPVHCEFAQIVGNWTLSISKIIPKDSVFDICQLMNTEFGAKELRLVELRAPNIVIDYTTRTTGNFTLIYDQGFEMIIDGFRFFAYFNYTTDANETVASHCDRTFTGFYHEDKINPQTWACYRAERANVSSKFASTFLRNTDSSSRTFHYKEEKRSTSTTTSTNNEHGFIQLLNSQQSKWKATLYPPHVAKFEKLSKKRMVSKSKIEAHFRHVKQMKQQFNKNLKTRKNSLLKLPQQFDWRNVSGRNFVSPPREQQLCGSCYAFATLGMFEARTRILSNLTLTTIYSPQDIVSCSAPIYGQGCDGGFPYLTSKYARDWGIVPENCSRYYGDDLTCKDFSTCPPRARIFASNYEYVGGWYGNTSEENLMEEIVKNGPVAAAFFVYDDFYKYKEGVYHHLVTKEEEKRTGNENEPHFEATNHAILLVGYGETDEGEKYWIGKNSWSSDWGMGGFFMIRRGTDECGIESLAVKSTLVIY